MMGTSLLAMPWAIKQAGFANGIILLIIMAALMAYTSYRVITSNRYIKDTVVVSEYSDVVKFYLGQSAQTVAFFSSVIILIGASIVYWIILSSSLYHIVLFIYENVHDSSNLTVSGHDGALCQNHDDVSSDLPDSFKRVWDETDTVPFFAIILVFPLTTVKSPTFFTKLTSFGIVSVTYLLLFVAVKAGKWGFHLNFDDSSSSAFTENFISTFPALTGISALAFFIHNVLMTVIRNQRHPENNTRDLIIAYCLVCGTYLFMGAVFYASFPLDKSCIKDNLLDNLVSTDIMAFIARVGLAIQMTCILPFILYVVRSQILQFFFCDIWPSLKHVLIFNTIAVAICVLFAVFLPQIGHIISFIGAFCGLSYAIVLPCLVYLVTCYRQGTLTRLNVAFHCALITIGVINFIAQFVIVGHTS